MAELHPYRYIQLVDPEYYPPGSGEYSLWLDDLRPAPEGWAWCKTVEEAIAIFNIWSIENCKALSLDNDLGEGIREGYQLVDWMERHNAWPRSIPTIHSMNPVRAEYMRKVIRQHYTKL